jgi:hypothetical protein
LKNSSTIAVAAALIVGHMDDGDGLVGPLADHVDAIVHDMSEVLGDPRLIAATDGRLAPRAASTVALETGELP